ncbi:hypothetical protein CEE44_02080 [Candidatus Woesearchaeota archaeon B3_Woes]|nr:MAG: hypothetical protein CEE44_02080 [Candidatus Woesearchaeota archaeon B3_Woes]
MIKNKIITLILMTFFIFFMFSNFAFGLVENFQFTEPESVSVYECVVSEGSTITVTNTGEISSSYTLNVKGSAVKFLSLGPWSFVLEPGQSQDIITSFSVPCGKKGNYDLKLHINTALNLEKTLKQKIVVEKPQNIEVLPVEFSKRIKPCSTASYQFNLKNTGDFDETYSLKFEKPFGLYANVSFNNVVLRSSQEIPFYIDITPPCNFYGNYTIPFSVKTLNTKLYAKTFAYLNIDRAYDYSLRLGEIGDKFIEHDEGEIYSLCTNSEETIPLKLKNNANFANVYNLNLKSPRWVKLSNNQIKLNKYQEKTVQISINTSNVEGDFNVILNIISELGEIQKTENITLSVDNCYKPYISTLDNKKEFVLDYNSVKTLLNVENKGSKTAKYDISLDAEDWLSLETSSLSVVSGKTGIINLVSVPTNTTSRGNYKANMQIKVSGTNVVYEESLGITLVTMNFFDGFYYSYVAPYLLYLAVGIFLLILILAIFIHVIKKYKRKIRTKIKKIKISKKKIVFGILVLLLVILAILALLFRNKLLFIILKLKWVISFIKNFLVSYWIYFAIGFGILLLLIILLLIIKKLKKRETKTKKVSKVAKKPIKLKVKKEILQVLLILIALVVLGFLVYYFILGDLLVDTGENITENVTDKLSEKPINVTVEPSVVLTFASSLWDFFVINVNYVLYVIAGLVILLFLFILSKKIKKRNMTYFEISSANREIILTNKRIACGEVIIKLRKTVSNVKLLLKKLKKPTFIKAADLVYEYFEFTQNNLETSDINEIVIRFRVKKSWLKKNNVKQSNISLRKYHHQWEGVNTKQINEDKNYYYYESIIKHLSYFAIVARKTEYVKVEKKIITTEKIKFTKYKFKKIFWFLIVFLILVIIALWGYYLWKNILNFLTSYKWYILGGIILLFLIIIDILSMKWLKKKRKGKARKKISQKTKKTLLSVLLFVILLGIITAGYVYLQSAFEFEKGGDNETIVVDEIIENKTVVAVEEEMGIIVEESFGIPDQKWDEDTKQIINLTKYFLDPDMDELYYTTTELQNIRIVYEEGNAILIPKRNWYGSEFVIFTANDMKGGKVDSNLIKLTVRDTPETNIFARLWAYISK